MHSRSRDGVLSGDSDWVRRSVVLDVPDGASTINYGIMLAGGGTLWARHVTVDAADPSEIVLTAPSLPRRPTNLGFGEAA
jgi:hypothetical protein